MEQKQQYVCGFLFNPTWERVLLIRKNRPSWQKNRLNGIGGKIEDNERPLDAMTREFKEEAGLDIKTWEELGEIEGDDFVVNFFFARSAYFSDAISKTDEKIEEHSIDNIPYDECIDNLRWIIPRALEFGKTGKRLHDLLRPFEHFH